jgi:hypothetical protein
MTELESVKRPKFLTVLCILTFIGVVITLIGSMGSYFLGRTIAAGVADTSNLHIEGAELKLEETPAFMNAMATFGRLIANISLISGISSALLCLWGAINMWKLREKGFYIYLAGQLSPLFFAIIGLVVILSSIDLNLLTKAFSSIVDMSVKLGGFSKVIRNYQNWSPIISIVFVILYALNLKHMKKEIKPIF